ncbi:MAG: hypothetical protein V1824_03120 [archaeon]
MNIKEDCAKLILYIYKQKIKFNSIPLAKELFLASSYDNIRFKNSLRYAKDNGYIIATYYLGSDEYGIPNCVISDLTENCEELINNLENSVGQSKFYKLFGIDLTLDNLLSSNYKIFNN